VSPQALKRPVQFLPSASRQVVHDQHIGFKFSDRAGNYLGAERDQLLVEISRYRGLTHPLASLRNAGKVTESTPSGIGNAPACAPRQS